MTVLSLDQFRQVWRSGGFQSVGITGAGGVFFVTGRPLQGERVTLATTRGKTVRAFRHADRAIAVLHGIGIRTIEVDTSAWAPEKASEAGIRRPDTARRQKHAHEAATHDAWFRREVAASLSEADDAEAEWVSNAVVKEHGKERRAAWLARIETELKPR